MWMIRICVVISALVCVIASPKCLLRENDKELFMTELRRTLQGTTLDVLEVGNVVKQVLAARSWIETGPYGIEIKDIRDNGEPSYPGVKFRIEDEQGKLLLAEEFIPLSTDTIVHFAQEFRKLINRKYDGDMIGYSNNAPKGCFGVIRVDDVKGPGLWKVVIRSGSGKVVADDFCIPKDMRVWDKYVVIITKTA